MYRIEITAETLTELAGKALALAAQFQTTAAVKGETSKQTDPVMPELREAAKQAPADPTPSEAASSGETEVSPTAPSGPEAPTTGEPQLDAVRDVQPIVLNAVGKIGKERVAEIVSSFGAGRVTQLDADKLPKLVARLEAEMAA
jgi:hypothetical protein